MKKKKKTEVFQENSMHVFGFVLHTADIHKPTAEWLMGFVGMHFWKIIALFFFALYSNFFL